MEQKNNILKSATELVGEGNTDLEKNLDSKIPDNSDKSNYEQELKKSEAQDAEALAAQRQAMGLEAVENEASVEQESTIENTSSFQEAISSGRLEEAAKWILDNRNNEKYDSRWLDHRSRELFKAARQTKNWPLAKQMAELGNGQDAIEGRRKVLEQESGLKYEQI